MSTNNLEGKFGTFNLLESIDAIRKKSKKVVSMMTKKGSEPKTIAVVSGGQRQRTRVTASTFQQKQQLCNSTITNINEVEYLEVLGNVLHINLTSSTAFHDKKIYCKLELDKI